MYGGLIDRVHDLLLCGVDPTLIDLSTCLSNLKSEEGHDVYSYQNQETDVLIRAASLPWTPSHHAYLYGSDFKASIASVFLVKVCVFDCPRFDFGFEVILFMCNPFIILSF